jgi:hypothetical protein
VLARPFGRWTVRDDDDRDASLAFLSGLHLPGSCFGVEGGVLDGPGVCLAAMDGHRRRPAGWGVSPPA